MLWLLFSINETTPLRKEEIRCKILLPELFETATRGSNVSKPSHAPLWRLLGIYMFVPLNFAAFCLMLSLYLLHSKKGYDQVMVSPKLTKLCTSVATAKLSCENRILRMAQVQKVTSILEVT